jgi:tetratricopeptide (TPR) repeat protein
MNHATTGKAAFEKEDNELAKDELDKALRTWTPGDGKEEKAAVLSILGSIHMAERKYDKALEYFQEVNKLNVKNTRAHFRIGLIYSVLGKNQQSIIELKKAIEEEPDFFMAQRTLGDIYKKEKMYEQAIQCYAVSTSLNPKSDTGYAGLGDCLKSLRKIDSAIPPLEIAVKLNTDNAIAQYNLGLCHLEKKQYDKAVDEFQNALSARVITLSAFKVQVLTFLGEAYEKSGQDEKAKNAYKQAKDLLDSIPSPPEKKTP